MIKRKRMNLQSADSPFYRFEVRDVSLGDLRFWSSHERHKVVKQFKNIPKKDWILDTQPGLPESVLFAENTETTYRGLPIPSKIWADVFEHFARDGHEWVDENGNSSLKHWCLCVNDPYMPTLLALFPAKYHSRMFSIEVQKSDVEPIQDIESASPYLRVSRFYIWYMTIIMHVKNSYGFGMFLPIPKAMVVPTNAEYELLESHPHFNEKELPMLAPYTLGYHNSGLLLYFRHPFFRPATWRHLPPFLPALEGCKWIPYKRDILNLEDRLVLRTGDLFPKTAPETIRKNNIKS